MNKSIYLLFMYICSSLAATTPYTTKKTGATIQITRLLASTTPAKKTINTTVSPTTTSKTANTISKGTKTAQSSTINATTVKTVQSPLTTSTVRNSTTMKAMQSSTAAIKKFTEVTTTPLSNFLIEKVNYQINQTHLLTDIVEENRSALKRLISMISHLLHHNREITTNHTNDCTIATNYTNVDKKTKNYTNDDKPATNYTKEYKITGNYTTDDKIITNYTNVDKIITNHTNDDEKQYIENTQHVNQAVHHDNDTLHVSFGTDADPDRYPWTVAIRGSDRDRCGGTLLDDQHVLTAAHCIGTKTTIVLLGSHLYYDGEEVKTNFYCVHNAYSSSNAYRNDIAVIRLSKPVTVRPPRRISTIKLCNRDNTINPSMSLNTVNLWMVGWGFKNNAIEPDELQEAQVTLAERSMCKGSDRYTDMCVQSRSSTSPMGACKGDSGSGLFQQTILTDQWCVLGVASTTDSFSCNQTQFTKYCHVASQDYVEWFRDVLDRKKPFDDLKRLERCKPKTAEQRLCRLYGC